jgi:hypothetical protein
MRLYGTPKATISPPGRVGPARPGPPRPAPARPGPPRPAPAQSPLPPGPLLPCRILLPEPFLNTGESSTYGPTASCQGRASVGGERVAVGRADEFVARACRLFSQGPLGRACGRCGPALWTRERRPWLFYPCGDLGAKKWGSVGRNARLGRTWSGGRRPRLAKCPDGPNRPPWIPPPPGPVSSLNHQQTSWVL